MNKMIALTLMLVISISLVLSGCGGDNENPSATGGGNSTKTNSSKSVKLSIYSTTNDQGTKDLYKKITDDFTKENPNVTFELQFPGTGYENLLKMKMSAKDLPDLFDTHGWSKTRYADFVADLSKESWVSNINDILKPMITDKDGKVYALPLNAAKDGITYNKEVLDKYQIAVPKTMDEMIAAGEKIYKESNGQVAPFFFSATDSGSLAQFYNYFATPLFISPKENSATALLDGTFDWSKWTTLSDKLIEMYDKKLINVDVFTVRSADRPRLFAEGKLAFVISAPGFVPEALKINPNLKVGIAPIPAMVAGDEPTFAGGERYTLAAWKESKNLDVAKQVINFFAKPENLKAMAEVTGTPAGMNGFEPDLGIYTEYYQQYKDTRVFPYFDRVYLPSGTWEVLKTMSGEVLSGSLTSEASAEKMKNEVERLKAQQK
jgi:raffinose/stachyose/melibiose transport system substrate-binding protein